MFLHIFRFGGFFPKTVYGHCAKRLSVFCSGDACDSVLQNLFYRRYQTKNAQTFGALCQTFWRDVSRGMSLCSLPVWCYKANAVRRIRKSRVKRRLPRRHGRALLHAARRRATCSCQFQSQIVVRVKCAAIEDFKKNGRWKYIPIPMQSIPFCPREASPSNVRISGILSAFPGIFPLKLNPEIRNPIATSSLFRRVSATSGGFWQVLTAFGGSSNLLNKISAPATVPRPRIFHRLRGAVSRSRRGLRISDISGFCAKNGCKTRARVG